MQADPEATCAACGTRGAFPFAGEALCGDCYAERGATCCADQPDAQAPASTPSISACTRPLLAT
jgi:hypothetical protein